MLSGGPKAGLVSALRWTRRGLLPAQHGPAGHAVTCRRNNATSTLMDAHGRDHTYLRISLTERCNLRCQYCMPENGVELTPKADLLTSDEVVQLANFFASEGVTKIRLTGGEPLVRRDICDLVRRLKDIPGIQAVGITTNGLTLGRKLPELHKSGLDALNISLDTMIPAKFEYVTRRRGHTQVLSSILKATEYFDMVKINAVVMRGLNEEEIPRFVELTRQWPVDIRFIEYMPFDGNTWESTKLVPYHEMLQRAFAAFPELKRASDAPNDTSKNWKVPGFRGQVGFITSMTQNFCSSCNRIRLTADGHLKVCLFGNDEVSLKDVLRQNPGASGDHLREVVHKAIQAKAPRHAGMMAIKNSENRPMIKIGG